MNTYHCTRNQPYQNPRCLGHNNLEVRQGYYIDATSEQEAIALMEQQFPDDDAGFTVRLWKIDCRYAEGRGNKFHALECLMAASKLATP